MKPAKPRKVQVECVVDGKPFMHALPMYCSPACKVKNFRRRRATKAVPR